MEKNLSVFKAVLRVMWALAGIVFIWYDIKVFGNTALVPTFWLIFGVLAFVGALTGLVGGLGAALLAQGILKYKQSLIIVAGGITFEPGFSLFDKVAHVFFVGYGIFLIIMQLKKNVKIMKKRGEA